MTREEAIGIWLPMVLMAVHDSPQCEEAVKMAARALEQELILNMIRAEIDEQYDRVHPYNISCAEGLEMALGIIDKYRKEQK